MKLFENLHRRKFLKYSSLVIGTLLSTVSCSRGLESKTNNTIAVSTSTLTSKRETIRLAQNLSPISGVAIVAKGKNFFDAHGLDVQVVNFTSGKQCLETVVGGGADIATTAEAPTTAAVMANQRIAFLARMEYSYLKTLATTSAGIKTITDLRGKRIGYTAGTGGEVYTLALLKKAGLTSNDVSLVNLRPQEMIPALTSGSIDAYNTWEPHIYNGMKALSNKAAKLDTKGIYSETFNIVTTADYLEQKPAVLKNFMRALLDAEEWMKNNKEDAITLVANAVSIKRDDLAAIWSDYVYEVALDQRTLDVLKTHAQWRLDSGNHPSGATMPDFTKVIYPEPLRSVAPNRVNIPL